MPASQPPYFFSATLRQRFALDVSEANRRLVISDVEALWLQRLVNENPQIQGADPLPRVDRLVMDDGSPVNAELTGALLISHADDGNLPVFLSTLLFGIERFEHRSQVPVALMLRFDEINTRSSMIDVQLVEGPLFEVQTRAIIRQQASHLNGVSAQLQLLPDLRTVIGHAAQASLKTRVPGDALDVFVHPVHVVETRPSSDMVMTEVVCTRCLADVAMDRFLSRNLAPGLRYRFLDGQGYTLSADQEKPYLQALDDAVSSINLQYDHQLTTYWMSSRPEGDTVHAFVVHALIESFRQHLLAGLADGSLTREEVRCLGAMLHRTAAGADPSAVQAHRISIAVARQDPVKLVGLLLIVCKTPESEGAYLYASGAGFRRFDSVEQVSLHFEGDQARTELLFHASLNDHPLLTAPGSIELHLETLSAPYFPECLDSIIALQKRNLRHAFALSPIHHAKGIARIDDALDIRAYVDVRLLGLHEPGRWRSGRWNVEQALDTAGEPDSPLLIDSPRASDTWAEKLSSIEALSERVDLQRPGVDGCMRQALNAYLAQVTGPALDARALWYASDAHDVTAVRLIALALDRLSGHTHVVLSSGRMLDGLEAPLTTQALSQLPSVLVEQILECVVPDFAARFEHQVQDFYAGWPRRPSARKRPDVLSVMIRERTLRLELLMEKRLGKLPLFALESVQQLVDRPVPAVRAALAENGSDAYTLSIQYDPLAPAILLPNAFVCCNERSGSYVMWSLINGFRSFTSLQALRSHVASLLTSDRADSWLLELLAEPDARLARDHLRQVAAPQVNVTLQKIEGHFLEALEQHEIKRQQSVVAARYRQAVSWQLPSRPFIHVLAAAERESFNRLASNGLGVAIQLIVYKTLVPDWISTASLTEQIRVADALGRFYQACFAQKDFLFDIPVLGDYSRQQLSRRLDIDFPGRRLDPTALVVTFTRYIPAPAVPGQLPQLIPAADIRVSANLAEFAVNRFMSAQEGVLSITVPDGQPLPAALTSAYIRELVNELDVAAGYRALLTKALDEDNPAYAERQRLFTQQLPSLDGLRALTLKLRGELSGDALYLIDAVLGMPDGIARLPVNGCKATFSPLRLLPAASGWTSTPVTGVYVIAPQAPLTGPWLLYVLMHDEFVFVEYRDQAALVNGICRTKELQDILLDRMDPDIRHVYDKGGFLEPHLPFSTESSWDVPLATPLPVTLDVRPFHGNALNCLFEDALHILTLKVRQQSVTSAEHRRAASRHLFVLGAEQIMALLPGRLGALAGLWQSQTLLSSSVLSAGQQHWGKALSEFMAALSVLISSRQDPPASAMAQGDDDAPVGEPIVEDQEEVGPEPVRTFPEFSWSNNSLTQQLRVRLRQYEASDIALNALGRDDVLNLYHEDSSGKTFAAVEGKPYEVQSDEDGWFIVANGVYGPGIRLDVDQHWVLDVQGGLKGGGGVVTRMKSARVEKSIGDVLTVSASGMADIRHNFSALAQAIEEGHLQARRYLENCLDNLTRHTGNGSLDPRVEKIIADFFDHPGPDLWLYDRLKLDIRRLFDELMDPSLSPIDSDRYVTGINRLGHEAASAFIFETDSLKRIFLTEQFFRTPVFRLKVRAMRSGSFRVGAHYRAAVLIHELSHLVLNTDDIAYVDAHAPFIDLLEDSSSYRQRLKNEQMTRQQKSLSYQTDRSQLFKQTDSDPLQDLRRADGNGKKNILRITGKRTLDEARDVFYADPRKRIEIMMSNADSVALLVTLLGRQQLAHL